MRSMEDPHQETREERKARVKAFGTYLTRKAIEAGFDVRPYKGGRAELARLLDTKPTTISRTLDGETLPLPQQVTKWAKILRVDPREMLVESGALPSEHGPEPSIRAVPSSTLTPEDAADAWGISDPKIRSMLLGGIFHAIQLQKETDAAEGRGAVARG
ncbi:transcriptional regulator [Streptomyces sp. RPA4-2]|uniref:transcriptional regulator n=1 Tax=unclassified Streptomyces TaxID=2593676 RepID=UPI00143E3BA9|nr:transcriptional regulator [Streptomyces sp. RPA4-2]QIY66361.1 transcriptional regulator [Streptomyces sp. RPA4-2]